MGTGKVRIKSGPIRSFLDGPDEAIKLVRKALTVFSPGAEHTTAYKIGRWDGYVQFLRRATNSFATGLLPRVVEILESKGWLVEIKETHPAPARGETSFGAVKVCLAGITLHDYQVEIALEAIKAKRLAIQCPTGSGKTEIGAAIVKQLRVPTLWLVHRKELLRQTRERLRKRFHPADPSAFGIVGAGKMEPGFVTVGMVQTLSKIGLKDDFWKRWKCLIVDEVHHMGADTWARVAELCENAIYRFGLSGTIVTGNAVKDLRLEGSTGRVYTGASTMKLAEAGFLAKPHIVMVDIGIGSYPTYEEVREAVAPTWRTNPRQLSTMGGKLFREAYYRGIIDNKARNKAIGRIAKEASGDGEKVLVLCQRLNHGRKLVMECTQSETPRPPVFYLTGSENDEIRQKALKLYREEKRGAIIIASTIFDEGVDVPEIDVLILAGGGESYIKSIQRVGRALRIREDKTTVPIYDFVDGRDSTNKKDYLAKHAEARLNDYQEQGFEIVRWPFGSSTMSEI